MRFFPYLLTISLVSSGILYAGVDSLFALCVKSFEHNGVHEFVESLGLVSEDHAFRMVCTSLLKSDTFSREEKEELVELLIDNSGGSYSHNSSFGSDIEMASSVDSLRITEPTGFYHPAYQDLITVCGIMFHRSAYVTINTPGLDERTLLHTAASITNINMANQIRLIKLLLSWGALCSAQDIHGNTPLHDAVSNVSFSIVATLLEFDEEALAINITNAKGDTPLHWLLRSCLQVSDLELIERDDLRSIVRVLCDAGADITLKNRDGYSAFDLATMLDCKVTWGITNILKERGLRKL